MTSAASLAWIDYLLMGIYFLFVIGIGLALKKFMKTSDDFFLSGRSIPAWVAGLAFVSANLGAQEVIGMGASGAKYGILTCHFYWVGAIPAMVFVGLFMMPFYYGSRAHSVPEYLKFRFDEKTRGLNAVTFAVMTIFSSGISMYAMGKLFKLLLGWNFHVSMIVAALIVLVYIFFGGLTSAIYNEVLQFFLIVFGMAPLVLLGLRDVGGWEGLKTRLSSLALENGWAETAYTQSWTFMDKASHNPIGVEWFGLVMGLGFVLSFGYWCTDFLVVQRAMAAHSMSAARRTPLIGAIPKMIMPALVILPGMIALAAGSWASTAGNTSPAAIVQSDSGTSSRTSAPQAEAGRGIIPTKRNESTGEIVRDSNGKPLLDFDLATPMMLVHYFPSGLLGLGLTALLASFMSGMAGNVTAFNTVWTYDIYRSYLNKKASDDHLLWMGRATTVVGIVLSLGTAYVAASFNNIMDMLQLVFAFVNAPLFATFALGMFWKRATGHGAFTGLLAGTAAAALHHGLTLPAGAAGGIKGGFFGLLTTYPSELAQTFWTAIIAWVTCFVVTILVSLVTKPRQDKELEGLVYSLTPKPEEEETAWWRQPKALGVAVLVMALLLNLLFY